MPGTVLLSSGAPSSQRSGLRITPISVFVPRCPSTAHALPLARVRAPHALVAVHGADRECNQVALPHADLVLQRAGLVHERPRERDRRVLRRHASRVLHGRVHAQALAHDRIEQRELVQRGERVRVERCVVRGGGRERERAKLGPQLRLDVRVLRELEERP
jgi:hypothetical protein